MLAILSHPRVLGGPAASGGSALEKLYALRSSPSFAESFVDAETIRLPAAGGVVGCTACVLFLASVAGQDQRSDDLWQVGPGTRPGLGQAVAVAETRSWGWATVRGWRS